MKLPWELPARRHRGARPGEAGSMSMWGAAGAGKSDGGHGG